VLGFIDYFDVHFFIFKAVLNCVRMFYEVRFYGCLGCPSPDSSVNPFLFFFKKEKIVADSGK
jgi:hypothetical protein